MPPIEKPTTDRLIEILRINDEAGDILCGHAADEIERLRLTDAEREAIDDAIYLCESEAGLFGERAAATKWATCAATLRGLLERTAKLSETDKPA